MKSIRWVQTGFSLLTLLLIVLTALPCWAEETSVVDIEMVVKVNDRAQAADMLVAAAQAQDGYFTQKARDAVKLRVPAARVKQIVAAVEQAGHVIDRKMNRQDFGNALIIKEAALKAKTESQRQYIALIDKADTNGALYIERELANLVAEIETLKGEIRQIRHRIAFAGVEVRFEYRDRSAPSPTGTSSFAWLNTMNLTDLLEEF